MEYIAPCRRRPATRNVVRCVTPVQLLQRVRDLALLSLFPLGEEHNMCKASALEAIPTFRVGLETLASVQAGTFGPSCDRCCGLKLVVALANELCTGRFV